MTQRVIRFHLMAMACRFPGGVSSPDDYWSLLRDGVDAITEVPKTRWDYERIATQIKSCYGRASSREPKSAAQ